VGVAQRMHDLHWLSRQHLYGAVADIGLFRDDGKLAGQSCRTPAPR
jgi:hypothetical protein